MNRCSFKPSEGKERLYNRRRRKEFYQSQVDRLPNELRGDLEEYNSSKVESVLWDDSYDCYDK